MASKVTRQSNIELLRIIAIMGVVLLHYNNDTMGCAFALTSSLPVNHAICVVFEALAVCGVNVFILISGYFLIDSDTRNISKVIELIFEVILFKLGITLISSIIHNSFSIKAILKSFIPDNYFVIIYLALYLISPLINAGFKKFSDKTKMLFLLICIIVFSAWTFAVDLLVKFSGNKWPGLSTVSIDGSSAGYTIVNFALMYLVGASIKLFKDKIKIKQSILIVALAVLTVVIVAGYYLIGSTMLNYNSPLIVAEAIIVFLIFSNINIGYKKWINELAKSTFICFLIHTYFLKYIFISYFAKANPFLLILHMLISPVVIYLICWLVYKVYNLIFGKLFSKLSSIPKMKIDFTK